MFELAQIHLLNDVFVYSRRRRGYFKSSLMYGRSHVAQRHFSYIASMLFTQVRTKKLRRSGNPIQVEIAHKILRGHCTLRISERNLNDSSFSIAVTLTALPTCDGPKVLAKKTNNAIADKRNIITIQVTFVQRLKIYCKNENNWKAV